MDNWDPSPNERQYFRSATTGDLGWLVRRNGQDRIRLDRPAEEIIRPYEESSWVPEHDYKPFTRTQVAMLSFEADKQLCRMQGLHKESRREWLSLSDAERIRFIEAGPALSGLRRELYLAIAGVLGKHAR